MATMKAVQISEAGGPFEQVERPIPEPGPGEVRLRVEACGICHSDVFVKDGMFPGLVYPRIPGHEVAGRVDAVGARVIGWNVGARAAVGWHGGHCGHCDRCRRGDFITCHNHRIAGMSYDGGYAEYMVAPENALARIPDALGSAEAAPLLCAGVTVYNALRHGGASPGDVVAIQGIGGLGHLAVQYAARMGYRVVALSNGPDKRELAKGLGAHHYVDQSAEDAAAVLQTLGGARLLLTTAPTAAAMTAIVDGLGVDGRMIAMGATTEPIEVSPLQLISGRRSISGWPSGSPRDSEDTMEFSLVTETGARIETYPLAEVERAYERMITNAARFRVVLTMN